MEMVYKVPPSADGGHDRWSLSTATGGMIGGLCLKTEVLNRTSNKILQSSGFPACIYGWRSRTCPSQPLA